MSTPKNHHYVSQCQSKNFFNEIDRKIYLYDKNEKRHFTRFSTERVFSEDYSNTRVQDGELDNHTLEKDLKDNYEDYYFKNLEIVTQVLTNPENSPTNYREALINLTKYAIAGELRNPKNKKESDDVIKNVLFNDLMPFSASELKKEFKELKEQLTKTNYSNTINYSEFAENVFKKMGGISCILYVIKCDKYFLLPDRPSITKRKKINTYFNPNIKEIAMVGIPLSSKIFLYSSSKKINDYQDKVIELTNDYIDKIDSINHALFHSAYKQIACEDETYLKDFVCRRGEIEI